jgi:hypothetical protein
MLRQIINAKNSFYNLIWRVDKVDRALGRVLEQLDASVLLECKIAGAMARGAATCAARAISPSDPETWEFSGFSQNGEDGIIDYLSRQLLKKNRYFVEFGAADGLENNTSWLAMARHYQGIMVEGDPVLAQRCSLLMGSRTNTVNVLNEYITLDNLKTILDLSIHKDPDVFSLDIDSVDYYIADAALKLGLRPKIVVVEYNSAFGPECAATIPYKTPFDRLTDHPSQVFYGVSVRGWRKLLEGVGYAFVGVESNGVNAFFIDPVAFPDGFAQGLRTVEFRDNAADRNGTNAIRNDLEGHRTQPLVGWKEQFVILKDLDIIYL